MQANPLKALIISLLCSTQSVMILEVCFGDPSLTLRMTRGLRMTGRSALRMTGELGRTRRSVMLNEVKHLSAEDPSLCSG